MNELAQKEKNYILEYNSKDEGYNSDSGGGIQKIVYQYDITNGTLLNAFDSLEAAGKSVNTTKQRISSSCLSVNQTYKGYYWSYEFIEPFSPKVDKRYKGVNQYDLKGNYMETYKSVAFASKITEISKTSIAKVCRGERKSAGGYAWSYSNGV